MRSARHGICLCAAMLMTLSTLCHAQSAGSVTPEDEYRQLIKVNQDVQPLGAHPFGENISLYDGSLSFEQTDLSLPGNGPTIQLGRTLNTVNIEAGVVNEQRPFGSWDLDIPRIETYVASPALSSTGAVWQNVNSPTQRCTYFSVPPVYGPTQPGADPWTPDEWWYGYHLMIPGQGSQELMPRGVANPLSPTMSGRSFPIVTKQGWMISCGVTASDGGEGFLAIAPDGTRYTFAWLVYRPLPNIYSPLGTPPQMVAQGVHPLVSPNNILFRREALMYVTQIQDRFGNTLTYHYSGNNLVSITASDGREADLTYVSNSPLVQTVTAKATDVPSRTWTYTYQTNSGLTRVQLPDGSAWSFNIGIETQLETEGGNCQANILPTLSQSPISGSITSPSGLTATFTQTPMLHGRSYVPKSCWGDVDASGGFLLYSKFPHASYQYSLTREVLTGAGLPTETWTYAYSPANESWTTDACATAKTCPTSVSTDVTDPEGHDVRYTFSNRFDASEGALLRTDYYTGEGGSTILRSVTNSYANPTGGPWPTAYGLDLQDRDNRAQTQEAAPLNLRQTVQNGDTYTWQTTAFNAYGQPTDVKRYNTIAGQSAIEETTSYLNDTNLWVLGLPSQVNNVTKGEVESTNTYATNDTLLSRARFGELLMRYTFNSAGQLASFTDGNAHTTTLGNYYRGIPRAIGYPDSTSESLAVDDFGQITAITDQAGHATSYSYDAVGRIVGISYPTGDEVAWYPTTFTYSFITGAERGLTAGHWDRTTATGNAVSTTYFDAMLRPVLSDSAIGSSIQASTLSTYDDLGQLVFSAYPSASAVTFTLSPTVAGSTTTYDALERVTRVQQSSELGTLTSSTAYLSGASRRVTDPKGNVTTTSYQVFDSPSYDVVTKVQAPAGVTQTISRDLYGNPLVITQSGLYGIETDSLTKTLTYDSYHRLCRSSEPESGSTVMAYDGANNLAWSAAGLAITGTGCGSEQVAAAAQTARTYDAMNRVKTILPPTGTQSTSYGYDPVGRLTSAVSGVTTWHGSYNFRGMLTGESLQLVGQSAWGIGYAHDANGSVSLIHYPDGENVSYAPDALGRPTQVGSYASSIGYFANGQVSQFLYGNGNGYVAAQNTRQLLSSFGYGPGGTPQVSEGFVYDKSGNITTVDDLAGGPRNKSFGYDALNRLTSAEATGLWGTQAFAYDALNNLRTLQSGSQIATYHYATSNQLASISGASAVNYTYDVRGNVATKNSTNLQFDQKNQLIQIVGADAYAYDAAGRRVSKKPTAGSPTYYFYSQAGQLMYQLEPGSARATSFIYLGHKLLAENATVSMGAPATIAFNANPNNGSYTVSWGAVSGATSYVLQESANAGAWTTVYSGSALSAALSGRAGGNYVYRVEGCIGTTCGAFTSSATLGVTPTLPTVTVPTGTINGAYIVSWTAPASATTYAVQERLNGGAWTTITSSTTATSISRPGTTSGSYTYQVAAHNAHGTRGWAASAAVTVNTAYGMKPSPVPTYTVPATNATGSVTVSWSAAAPVTQYTLQQSSNGGASWSTAYAGVGTSVALSGLADGSYTYRLQACNDTAGNSACTAWVAAGPMVVTHPPTTAPTLSVPASGTSGSYTVSWSGVPAPVSYTVQESANGGGWSTVQANGMTSWSTSGRGNGSYGYRVQACNAGGCGPWSVTRNTTVLLVPPTPASISIPATSNGPVAVSWAASTTATSYTLQHANSGVTGWSTIYNGGATSYTRYETTTGTWIYQVQACNASGCSAFRASSGGVIVTIAPGSAPSLNVPATSSTGSYTVSWGAVSGATSYTLQESANGGGWSTVQSSSATSKAISGKGNGSYGYQVQACNAGGCGPWSATGTISVTLIPVMPSNPLTLSVTGPTNKPVIHVTWIAIAYATSYTLQMDEPAAGTGWTTVSGSSGWSSLFLYNGEVDFRLQACDSAGCSAWSTTQSVTVHGGPSGMSATQPAASSSSSGGVQ